MYMLCHLHDPHRYACVHEQALIWFTLDWGVEDKPSELSGAGAGIVKGTLP